MKRLLLSLLVFLNLAAQSQVYNNEWIDYNKTYYKFKVGSTGLYRIDQSTLASIGLGSIPAEQFQLWRNGQQIPLYTSVQTSTMGGSDYIEFWGEMNDGKPDNALYRDPEYQLNDKWSLQTDTAAFFLTVNTSGINLRLEPTSNNVAGNILSPEPYFIHTTGAYWKQSLNPGYAAVVGEYVYSAAYDQGEGWSSVNIGGGGVLPIQYTNLFPYTGVGAPSPTLKVNASGNALNQRQLIVKLNGNVILNQTMDYFDYVKGVAPVNIADIASGTANIEVINGGPGGDRMAVAQSELIYPRQFNFDNARNFSFEIPANTNGNYLEVSNFNYGTTAPVLYDLTNGKRYIADITNPSLIKIALLPSSVNRKLLLVNEEAINIANVTSFQQRNFINFSLPANQGNYLIITHPVLTNGSGGVNPIDAYKVYRNSGAGGGYNVKVYMIDELVDQFGLGIKKTPLAVRNFILWARSHFSTVPIKDVLLIGKGVSYNQYRGNENNPDVEKLCLIPTWGNPASDNLLTADPGLDEIPKVPIGRISAITGDEVSVYLAKLIQYEQTQALSSPLIADKAWMKNVLHVVGVSDDNLQSILDTYMGYFKNIISDTLYAGKVHTLSKTSADEIEQQSSNSLLKNLFHEGLGLITYFGHSSATSLAFNLDNPYNYDNQGKYPVMIALGCIAGNFFNFNVARFQLKETISEKFVLADQRGSIAFVASSHFGIVHYLNIYNTGTYNALAKTHYGKTLGETLIESIAQTYNITTQNDYYARFHCEEIVLHGDPALKINAPPKPDYAIEDQLVKISPQFISVGDRQFTMNVQVMNLGKAIDKNIVIEIKRTYPDLTTEVIKRDTISGIRFVDSLTYNIDILPTRDKGLNKITITIDVDNEVDELYETNNTLTKDIFIFEDEARPVYPYSYAIVNQQNIKLYASTANSFASLKQYNMEIDTTALFNSPLKITRSVSSTGGLLEFTPGLTFTDSTVYYWRVAPLPSSGSPIWNTSSFIYLPNSDFGFNQSHFYQHEKSAFNRVYLDTSSRSLKYGSVTNNIFIRSGIYPTSSTQQADYAAKINDKIIMGPGCNYNELIINVIDAVTFQPWRNQAAPGGGLYGSSYPFCGSQREYTFNYFLSDTLWRRRAQNFLENIVPDGAYVVIRSNTSPNYFANTYAPVWKNDTTFFGPGNSLYHTLKNQGFSNIDMFDTTRAFAFVYKKNGQSSFTPQSVFTTSIYDRILMSVDCPSPDSLGFIKSPSFGPAKEWKRLIWQGNTQDALPGDAPTVDVIGIDVNGTENTLISNLTLSQQDVDISSIDASQYPYISLKMRNIDSVNLTPYQLKYWRLTYTPVPEGAISPNIYYSGKDSVDIGEPVSYGIAFKNIGDVPFADSMKIKFAITNQDNAQTVFFGKHKVLQPGDTIRFNIPVESKLFPGHNTVFFNFNPDFDQPEMYNFNNFAFRKLYVKPDSLNPLMDVTFDGVHILNRDIVSSKPDIIIKLKDEAKWLILDDTSLVTLQVRYPNGDLRRFHFNNDTLKFTAAGQAPNSDNTATISFKPYFFTDGMYELVVTGKDKSDNAAGNIEYKVSFEVINKPMISNMLNYPNPFTSSTAFVFTITGNEVPQNIKIEIMTVTGKIVREITKDELGPLHIGRNITEFKWDGTDQYGQKLANGIYLYRVVTNLNGKVLDKYKAEGDNTDQYFNKGYGKMYLMR